MKFQDKKEKINKNIIIGILSLVDNKTNQDSNKELRDRFILSKGHACLAYYASLNLLGFISDEELKTFEKDNSSLAGHPVKNKELGIDFSNGSLGMGLSIGIGLAISSKKKSI